MSGLKNPGEILKPLNSKTTNIYIYIFDFFLLRAKKLRPKDKSLGRIKKMACIAG